MLRCRRRSIGILLVAWLFVCTGCREAPDSTDPDAAGGITSGRVPDASRLTISLDGKETRRAVTAGQTVKIDGKPFRVEAIRAWSGIVRTPQGEPMVVLSLLRGGEPWIDDAMIGADAWLSQENTGVVLRWHETEGAAEKAANRKSVGTSDSARWGVRDTNRIHWFNTFAPGTGAETDDGTFVSIYGMQRGANPADTTLDLFVRKGQETRRELVKPHTAGPESLILFEDPAALASVLVIHGWRDDAAIATWYRRNKRVSSSRLVPGVAWLGEGASASVRLEQIFGSAASVTAENSTVDEIVLAGEQRRFRVREGEVVRIGDARVRFMHSAPMAAPPAASEQKASGE